VQPQVRVLSVKQPVFIVVFGLDQELAAKWLHNWSTGLIKCVLHSFSSLTRLKGSWGQLWPKTDPEQQKTKTKMIIFPRGLTATRSNNICAIQNIRRLVGKGLVDNLNMLYGTENDNLLFRSNYAGDAQVGSFYTIMNTLSYWGFPGSDPFRNPSPFADTPSTVFVNPITPALRGQNLTNMGLPKGSRSGCLAKCFLEAWGTKTKKPHIFAEKSCFLALVPQASKNRLANNKTSGSL
jgi:hypothetical protein